MRRLWSACILLVILVSISLWEGQQIHTLMNRYIEQTEQVYDLTRAGRWEDARTAAQDIVQDWQSHDRYLRTQLRHQDIDNIFFTLQEMEQCLKLEKWEQYTIANAKLTAYLTVLGQTELPTWGNIL